jgi:hypothetical protein
VNLFREIAVNYGPFKTAVLLLLLSISLLPVTFAAEITRVVAVGRDGNNLALKFSPNVTIANVGEFQLADLERRSTFVETRDFLCHPR